MKKFAMENFLPTPIIEEIEFKRFKDSFKKTVQIVLVILAALLIVLMFLIGYNHFFCINVLPADLSSEYNDARQKSVLLQRRNEVLAIGEVEDRGIVRNIDLIVSLKPPEIKLTRIDIDSTTGVFNVEGFANDPSIFNRYVEQINLQMSLGLKAQVDRISSSEDGIIKSFVIRAIKEK